MAFDRLRGNRDSRRIVVLDSSALLMLFEHSLHLDHELQRLLGSYRVVVPLAVLDELEKLALQGKGKFQRIAKPALALAHTYEHVALETGEKGDDAVIRVAQNCNGIVVTTDQELQRRLKALSLQTISLRGQNHLILK